MKWFDRFQKWYARKYVCPFWGHRPEEGGEWTAVVIGEPETPTQQLHTCANCGQIFEKV